jgi:hypothetical protein
VRIVQQLIVGFVALCASWAAKGAVERAKAHGALVPAWVEEFGPGIAFLGASVFGSELVRARETKTS